MEGCHRCRVPVSENPRKKLKTKIKKLIIYHNSTDCRAYIAQWIDVVPQPPLLYESRQFYKCYREDFIRISPYFLVYFIVIFIFRFGHLFTLKVGSHMDFLLRAAIFLGLLLMSLSLALSISAICTDFWLEANPLERNGSLSVASRLHSGLFNGARRIHWPLRPRETPFSGEFFKIVCSKTTRI